MAEISAYKSLVFGISQLNVKAITNAFLPSGESTNYDLYSTCKQVEVFGGLFKQKMALSCVDVFTGGRGCPWHSVCFTGRVTALSDR